MPIPTIAQLNNVALDCQTIEDVVNSLADVAVNRNGLGVSTLTGFNKRMIAAINAIGYEPPVLYSAGLNVTDGFMTVEYNDNLYAPIVSKLPFITSGVFESDKFRVIQGLTKDELPYFMGFVNNRMFGAVCDGVIDDTTANQSALDAGVPIMFIGTSAITELRLNNNQTLICSGATLIMLDRTKDALNVNNIEGWSINGNLKIKGTNATSGGVGGNIDQSHGLNILDSELWSVDGVDVSYVEGTGFKVASSVLDIPTIAMARMSNCSFHHNSWGINTAEGFNSEYINMSNVQCFNNANGARIVAGNIMWVGGTISHSINNGLELIGGFNPHHGAIVGVSINHNVGQAIEARGTYAGQLFSGCTVFDNSSGTDAGRIGLYNAGGLNFVNCELMVDFYSEAVGAINKVTNCIFATGNGAGGRTYKSTSSDGTDKFLIFRENEQILGDFTLNSPTDSGSIISSAIPQVLGAGEVPIEFVSIREYGIGSYNGPGKNLKLKKYGDYEIILDVSLFGEIPSTITPYGKLLINDTPVMSFNITSNGLVAAVNTSFFDRLRKDDVISVVINKGSSGEISAVARITCLHKT